MQVDFPNLLVGLTPRVVLCWVGSEEEEDPIVGIAKALAEQVGGRCEVIMGMVSPLRQPDDSSGTTEKSPLTPQAIAHTQRKLTQLYGSEFNPVVLPGHPVTEVRRFAASSGADLLVMGEQAFRIESDYGERLADEAPCAVMILIPQANRGEVEGKAPLPQPSPNLQER